MKLNQKGASLTEVLISVGILSILIASLAYLMNLFNQQSVQFEKIKDVNLANIKIRTLLSQREACSNTLQGAAAGPLFQPTAGPIPSIRSEVSPPAFGQPVYSAGNEVMPNVLINSMRTTAFAASTAGLPGNQMTSLVIDYRITGAAFPGMNYTVQKIIPIYMNYNGPTFVDCTTTGHIGTDGEYLNHFVDDVSGLTYVAPDVIVAENNRSFFRGDMRPAPVLLAAPFNLNFMFGIRGRLFVEPVAANPNTGYIAAQNFSVASDETKKSNIKPLSRPLERIQDFKVYNYNFIGSDRAEIGLISQDLVENTPLVKTLEDGSQAVNYNGALGLNIEATKALHEEQKALKRRLKKVKQELRAIAKEIKN